MKKWEQILYASLFFFFGLSSLIFGSLTFDIQWGTYDFTQVYEDGSTRTSRFLYHFGIMARVAVGLLYLLRRINWKQSQSFEFFIVITTFLYMLKECWDVAYCNNITGTVTYEIVTFVIVLIGGYFCTTYKMDSNGTT